MANIIFKRLFEVRILHDYFLASQDGSSVFDLNDATRQAKLTSALANRQYGLMQDISIEPTSTTQEKINNNRLVFALTATGFIVGIEVVPQRLNDGAVVYKPIISLAPESKFDFWITINNPLFRNYSNIKFSPKIQSAFYFSNQYPDKILSSPIHDFENGRTYDMGELAIINNSIQEAILETNTTEPKNWQAVKDKGFVNEADRIVLPKVFQYPIPPALNLKEVSFILLNLKGETIKTISVKQESTITNVPLNFKIKSVNPLGKDPEIPDGKYNLLIASGEDFKQEQQVYLNDEVSSRHFGLVEINARSAESDAHLLDEQGFLITKITAEGQKTPHPIFEIRIRSRLTYWRYLSSRGRPLQPGNQLEEILEKNNGGVITKRPQFFRRGWAFFKTDKDIHLPIPEISSIKREKFKGSRAFFTDHYLQNLTNIKENTDLITEVPPTNS